MQKQNVFFFYVRTEFTSQFTIYLHTRISLVEFYVGNVRSQDDVHIRNCTAWAREEAMSDGILELFLREASESGDYDALGGNGSEGEHGNHTHGEEAHGAHGGHGTVLFLFTAFAVGG